MTLKETYKGKKIYKTAGSRPWTVQHSWASGASNDLDSFSSLKKARAFIDRMIAANS